MMYNELLRYAIVEKACKDYEWALRYLNRLDHVGLTLTKSQQEQVCKARRFRDDCENFFRGEWMKALSDLDGEMLIRVLRERAITEKSTICRHKIEH